MWASSRGWPPADLQPDCFAHGAWTTRSRTGTRPRGRARTRGPGPPCPPHGTPAAAPRPLPGSLVVPPGRPGVPAPPPAVGLGGAGGWGGGEGGSRPPSPSLPGQAVRVARRLSWSLLPLVGGGGRVGGGGPTAAVPATPGARGSRSAAAVAPPVVPPTPHCSVGPRATARAGPRPRGGDPVPLPHPGAPSWAVGI